jgi:hypothetical protein
VSAWRAVCISLAQASHEVGFTFISIDDNNRGKCMYVYVIFFREASKSQSKTTRERERERREHVFICIREFWESVLFNEKREMERKRAREREETKEM